ncbi:putative monooxygenase [Cryphonectria parasitica EP155]|uniref:Monooxygenase n=1 Tax=Cryphonectria parasitica (strain ATCC 38755 / EP155) TaxID=660469 RepID=A0A9P5CSF7_CRYP1|nr:putative monooxygenase [Cryphonectria parasitica EP155]KAF3768095.1 putative monooxygenase [Cryphonectria parasitica EP155]
MGINKDLHIAIIGAGMGGLATALALAKEGFTHIDVYEAASDLGFVGAGIQLAPNMARILDRLGVWKPIAADATKMEGASIRKGATNEELAYSSMMWIPEAYGYQHMVGHRASLAGEIYEGAKREKAINFKFASPITEVKTFSSRPTFVVSPRKGGGEPYTVECDVLLGADGVKSQVRVSMLKELKVDGKVVDSGQAAYRIMLDRDQMKDDPELLALIDGNQSTRWIGEKKHIIAYPVSSKTIYNISTAHPDTNFAAAPDETYTTRGSKESMLAVYDDFAPICKKMLNMVPEAEVCEWKLRVHQPLPTWVHGTTALIGDACHPTLPHLNQGAAQAIEDAAVIAIALARTPDASPESINKSLKVYEKLRKERAEACVAMAAANGKEMQLGDGAAAAERDAAFKAFKENGEGKVPDKAADKGVLSFIYEWDASKETEKQYESIFQSL